MLFNFVISFVYYLLGDVFLPIIMTFLAWLEFLYFLFSFLLSLLLLLFFSAACWDYIHLVVGHDVWFTQSGLTASEF